MIISRTPYRISFFGGGTDYPSWYHKHGGEVLATSIDKYCYLTARFLPPFFEHRTRVVYSTIENVQHYSELQHPAVREVLRYLNFERGVEIHHDGDLPARSGMGTSSSFTVGLLHALYGLMGKMPTKHDLAQQSIEIEQEKLKENVGSQDQMSAAYGGCNHIVFKPCGEIAVEPLTVPRVRLDELNSHLMLFYTGIKRTASVVAKSYTDDMDRRRRQLRIMKDLVHEGISVINSSTSLLRFGELLDEAWQAKRSLSSSVSNPELDGLYARAREAGALGGKLTGAGGGGFMVLFVPPAKQLAVRKSLDSLIHVPFSFDHFGTHIVYYETDRDYTREENYWDQKEKPVFKEGPSTTGHSHAHAAVPESAAETPSPEPAV